MYYLYDRAPNAVERLEMSYRYLSHNHRSIGRQYDWDLEKYRLGKKGVDRGNKKRFFKNAFRFIKNPVGYITWKSYRYMSVAPKLIVASFLVAWFYNFMEYKQYSIAVDKMDQTLQMYGKNVEGSQGRMKGYHTRKLLRSPNAFDYMMRAPLTANEIILNQTWTQNLRKEIQLTNHYNVEFK